MFVVLECAKGKKLLKKKDNFSAQVVGALGHQRRQKEEGDGSGTR